jgi:hypothetical protein
MFGAARIFWALPLSVAAILAFGAQPGSATGTAKLVGVLGPGFTIAIENARGHRVASVPPGRYRITIHDLSAFLDFHLHGPGVNKRTTVAGTGTTTWTVSLRKGTYTYDCDAHANIVTGRLTVP